MARTVEPTRTSALLVALFAVLMLGLLGVQVALLTEQRRIIKQQRVLQEVLVGRSLPVLDDLRPVADATREALPATRRRAAEAAALVREARPLVAEARPLVAQLSAAVDGGRLTRALDAALGTLAELRARELLADADRAAESVPVLLGVQREALALLRESRDIQGQTLAIQREALTHIRSLDAKTGGRAPAAAGSRRSGP